VFSLTALRAEMTADALVIGHAIHFDPADRSGAAEGDSAPWY